MSQQKNGKFIVFEGIDGAGKTTQIDLLVKRMQSEGRTVYRTAEPTESTTGGMLRDALAGIVKRTPCELAALFTLDRIQHNVNPKNGIAKFLDAGTDVICDRYYYSTLAYQGSAIDGEWVKEINLDCPEIRRPDLCVFLDLTPEESMARISRGRVTQEIFETRETLERVRGQFTRVFEELGDAERIEVIDAARPAEEIHEEIWNLVKKTL